MSESEREIVYVCWLDKESTDDFGSNCKLPDNPNWENYNAKRKRPLRSAITARALVTTSDIKTPGTLERPPGLPRMVFQCWLVGWQQYGILL